MTVSCRETISRVPSEIIVPRLGATDRLVELPPLALVDAATGKAPRLATAVRFGARGGDLVVRFDARHRGVSATLTEENASLWTEDVVEVFLSAEDPPRHYLELEVNPLGTKFSARVDSPLGTREGMRVETFSCSGFAAQARVRERSWSARLRIPMAQLFGAFPPAFSGNVFRIDRGSAEFSALSPTGASPPDFHRPAAFARFRVAVAPDLNDVPA
jgi:hypothetical protein